MMLTYQTAMEIIAGRAKSNIGGIVTRSVSIIPLYGQIISVLTTIF